MNAAMKVLSILGVLLRWACGGGEGHDEAPPESRFSVDHAPLRGITPRT